MHQRTIKSTPFSRRLHGSHTNEKLLRKWEFFLRLGDSSFVLPLMKGSENGFFLVHWQGSV